MLHGWQYLMPEDREIILRGITDGQVYGGPYHLELDWVDRCSARCFFCNSRNTHDGDSIPWPRALALLEEARGAGLRSIRLAGGGEPTLHPHLTELLEWLGESGIALDNLTTNGLHLTNRLIDSLMGTSVHSLMVSLNYCDAEIYGESMGLPARTFSQVCAAVKSLDAARRNNPRFGRLFLQFFVSKATRHQIRQMVELGRELGADVISLRELFLPDPSLSYTAEDVPALIDQLRPVLREDWTDGRVECLLWSHGMGPAYGNLCTELERELGPAPAMARAPIDYRNRYCYIPWYSMTLIGSQVVYPCCFYISDNSARTLGSLKGKRLAEVWHGPAYQRFRQEMRDFAILQERIPFFSRRVRYLQPRCASHFECPMTSGLCEESFYADADRRLRQERERLATRLWRLSNHVGRSLVDVLRGHSH